VLLWRSGASGGGAAVGGRRWGQLAGEQVEIAAVGDGRQAHGDVDGVADGGGVGAREHGGGGGQLVLALAEAAHAQIEAAIGLGAARVLDAGGAVHGRPRGGAGVEGAEGAIARVAGQRRGDRVEARGQGGAQARRPHRGQLGDATVAARLGRGGVGTGRGHGDRGAGGEHRDAAHDRQAPSSPAALAREQLDQRGHRRVAIGRARGEASADRRDQPRRCAAGVGGRDQRAGLDAGAQRGHAVAGERRGGEQRAVERDAERELIGRGGGGLSGELLGGHERRRADHGAGVGDGRERRVAAAARLVVVAARHREPEVGDVRRAAGVDQHVVGLEVAMHQAGGVGGGEPAASADEDLHDRAPVAGGGGQPAGQRAAVDQLHRDEHLIAAGAGVEHGHDVGVTQAAPSSGPRAGAARGRRCRRDRAAPA
jgi:hypothetical protein